MTLVAAGSPLEELEDVDAFQCRLVRSRRRALGEALAGQGDGFPLRASIKRPRISGSAVCADIGRLRRWLEAWRRHDDGLRRRGTGEVEFEIRSFRAIRDVELARAVVFETPGILAGALGLGREWACAEARFGDLDRVDVRLRPALARRWDEVAGLPDPEWTGFLRLVGDPEAVALEVSAGSRGVRVQGLHSKWFEQRRALVGLALSALGLDAEALFGEVERAFLWVATPAGSRDAPFGIRRFAVRPGDLSSRPEGVLRVLVVENRECFERFAPTEGALIFWGRGYAAPDLLARLGWADRVELYYWGDCDTDGYVILSMVRAIAPKVVSVLMDEATIEHGAAMIVPDPVRTAKADLSCLSSDEARAYARVRARGERLEQERVEHQRACSTLADLALVAR